MHTRHRIASALALALAVGLASTPAHAEEIQQVEPTAFPGTNASLDPATFWVSYAQTTKQPFPDVFGEYVDGLETLPVLGDIPGARPTDGVLRAQCAEFLASNPLATMDEESFYAMLEYECLWFFGQIVWNTVDGERIAYPHWTAPQKERLHQHLVDLLSDEGETPDCPDPYLQMALVPRLRQGTGAWIDAKLPRAGYILYTAPDPADPTALGQAFDVFVAHVAQAINLEARALVPWSLLDMPAAEVPEIFDSARYFEAQLPEADLPFPYSVHGGSVVSNRGAGQAVERALCDPSDAFRFISGETSSGPPILADTREQTMVNLHAWARDSLQHGLYDPGTLSYDDYSYPPDVADHAFLADRLVPSGSAVESGKVLARAGCHSAAGVLQDLARGVNISLLAAATGHEPGGRQHAGLVFDWATDEPRVLYHTDIVYAYGMPPEFHTDTWESLAPSDRDPDRDSFDSLWLTPEGHDGFRGLQDLGLEYAPEHPSIAQPNAGYIGAFASTDDWRLGDVSVSSNVCGWNNFMAFRVDTSTGQYRDNAAFDASMVAAAPGSWPYLFVHRLRADRCLVIAGGVEGYMEAWNDRATVPDVWLE